MEEYQRAITAMHHEATHMARLAAGLLTLARADSGQSAPAWEEVDLGEIALDVVERLTPLAQRSGMTLTLDLPDELSLRGDPVHLTQLLMNLTENALKHGAGVCTRVCIMGGRIYEHDRAEIRLRVVDGGPGIAAAHLSHLGERFYRVDQARTHNTDPQREGDTGGLTGTGSGLGLAIAHWITRAHGGSLLIESEVGHGATFEVRLPCLGEKQPGS
ncbi:MAG: sensor histidine kinase [Chloroflexota bacterium]